MHTVHMGIPGVGDVTPGSHLCALYSGPGERDEILYPFLEEGLRHGDKLLCLIDDVEPDIVRDRTIREADTTPGPEQLNVDRASHVYLRSGQLSTVNMLTFLAETVTAAEQKFPLVRAAGEMSWVLPQPPGASEFFVYESAVNRLVHQVPTVFMCMYDVHKFDGGMLVDVLRTHPKVLLDGAVLDNPHYLAPSGYPLARRRDTVPAPRKRANTTDQWDSLTAAEVRVVDLVAGGMTNRSVARRLVVSPHTVDAHLKHIYTKLDVHSRVELTVLAIQYLRPLSVN